MTIIDRTKPTKEGELKGEHFSNKALFSFLLPGPSPKPVFIAKCAGKTKAIR